VKRVSEQDEPVGGVRDGSGGAEEPGKARVAPTAILN